MPALVHCVYASVQTRSLTPAEITSLMQHSQTHNKAHGLTGILLHVKDTFFQVLEGPRDVIEALYAKILVDPRHHKITCIIDEPIPKRFFADSDMTLLRLTPQELAAIVDEDDPRCWNHLLLDLNEGRAKRLLRAFSEGRWRHQASTASYEREVLA